MLRIRAKGEIPTRILWINLKETDYLKDLGVDGRILN
jgi:hypothetical protein